MNVVVKTQLSIVIPNQPGQIARVSEVMTAHKVNISGVMFVDTTQQGVVRFVVQDAPAAQAALEKAGFFVVAAEIAEVTFDHHIGALFTVSKALGEAGVNIDYAYGSDNPDPKAMKVAFKLSDLEKGIEVLKKL